MAPGVPTAAVGAQPATSHANYPQTGALLLQAGRAAQACQKALLESTALLGNQAPLELTTQAMEGTRAGWHRQLNYVCGDHIGPCRCGMTALQHKSQARPGPKKLVCPTLRSQQHFTQNTTCMGISKDTTGMGTGHRCITQTQPMVKG